MGSLIAQFNLGTDNAESPSFCMSITSNDLWQCAGSIATGSTAEGNVGKIIGAAFNRGIVVNASDSVATSLNDITCGGNVRSFYGQGTKHNE